MRQAELSLKDISEHQMFLSALEARALQLTPPQPNPNPNPNP